MKILHLLQSNMFSGAENVVCQIICMMKDELDIDMVYSSREGQIRAALTERKVSFAPLKEFSVNEVKRVIKEQKPDIVHAHDMRASFVAALACGNVPLVSHIHNNNYDSRRISIKSIAYLYAAIKANHIFWVSKSSFEGYAFHSLVKKKSEILNNIIDPEALIKRIEQDTNNYEYDVVYVGRLTYQKNPQRLVAICKLAAEKKPDIKIAIIGTGDLESETRLLIQQYHIDKNIDMFGFKENPLKILHDAKVMVMPSRWEGTPMVALEAMALGVPIVSTPTDGLNDLIEDDKNGYLSQDDDVLVQKILNIILSPQLRRRLSDYAIRKSQHINDIETYKQKLMFAYGRELHVFNNI